MPSFSVPEETASSGSQPFHTELGKGAIFPSGGKGDKEKKWWGSGERGAPEAHRNLLIPCVTQIASDAITQTVTHGIRRFR